MEVILFLISWRPTEKKDGLFLSNFYPIFIPHPKYLYYLFEFGLEITCFYISGLFGKEPISKSEKWPSKYENPITSQLEKDSCRNSEGQRRFFKLHSSPRYPPRLIEGWSYLELQSSSYYFFVLIWEM